jgi:hypothetical protein
MTVQLIKTVGFFKWLLEATGSKPLEAFLSTLCKLGFSESNEINSIGGHNLPE